MSNKKIDGETNTFKISPWKPLNFLKSFYFSFSNKSKWESIKFLHVHGIEFYNGKIRYATKKYCCS